MPLDGTMQIGEHGADAWQLVELGQGVGGLALPVGPFAPGARHILRFGGLPQIFEIHQHGIGGGGGQQLQTTAQHRGQAGVVAEQAIFGARNE